MGTKATAANSQKNHKNTWHKQQWTLTPLWKRFSSVLSRLDYFERTVVGTKNQLVHPQQTLQESFRILSSLNSFFGAVRQSNPTRDELAQVESSYASLERKACDIEQKIIMLHKYSNAVDSHQPLMKLRGKADELSNEYTCAVVCGLGQIAGNEEKAFFARLSQLEHQLITLQKNFNLVPALSLHCIAAQKNLLEIKLAQANIVSHMSKISERLHKSQSGIIDSEGVKVRLVKALLQASSGKLTIDRKHVTVKAANGSKQAFVMDEPTKAAVKSLFENTNIYDTLQLIAGNSDEIIVAHFSVKFDGDSPSSINITIGDRKHENNTITFNPVRMFLPQTQVITISSLQL